MTERLDRFDLARNTLVNTLKDHVDRDPTLQPTPPETIQNIEAADFLDAHSLMASLLDNHHTRRYGATYTHKGGKINCKRKRNKGGRQIPWGCTSRENNVHFGLLEGQCRQIPYACKAC